MSPSITIALLPPVPGEDWPRREVAAEMAAYNHRVRIVPDLGESTVDGDLDLAGAWVAHCALELATDPGRPPVLLVAHGTAGRMLAALGFESRQALFDELLPAISEQMLDFIKQRADATSDEPDREEKSFRAFFDFLAEHPEFFRVMYEAEVFAPEAYQRHTDMVLNGFVRILTKASRHGDIKGYDASQIEALGLILMGARHYLCSRYGRQNGWKEKLPEKVVAAYMRLLRHGLYGEPAEGSKRR